MKRKLTILTFLTMFCSFVFGQSPDWGEFSVNTYPNYMTVLASIEIDGDVQSNPTLEVAPFCGNERRGPVRKTIAAPNGKYIAELNVYGNENDIITFKLYDSNAQTMYEHNVSNNVLKIIINEYIGSLSSPYAINFNSVAKIGDVKFASVKDAVNYAQNNDIVTVTNDNEITSAVVINKNITLDLNGKDITAGENIYPVIRVQDGANVTIAGNGSITNATDYVFVLGSADETSAGNLTIENGTFHGATTVASVTKGNLVIEGGEFSVKPYQGNYAYLINCYDANYTNGTAQVAISGGTFHNWNPENNAAEGAGTDFCAEGYFVKETSENVFTVVEGLLGEGTETEPFIIRNLKELKYFRDHVNDGKTKYNAEGVHVALAANIDMAKEDWSNNIGDDCNYTFDGIFDGKGFTLSNLNSTETTQKADGYICTGLFGAIYSNAVIKNLTIENVNISTAEYTGNNVAAVVGFAYIIANKTATIENVIVKGNISINAPKAYAVGTIVGYSYEPGNINITNCAVEANEGSAITAVSGSGAIIGHAAGIVTLEDCSVSNIDITAKGLVGGIAGLVSSSKSIIDNNTVKNVALTATEPNWVNSAAIAVGTMVSDGLTVANTTFENVNASKMVGSIYAKQPTTVVPAVEARIGDVYYTTFNKAYAAAQEGNTITVISPVVVTETTTYDFAGLNIEGENVYPIFRIQNGATMTVENANITNATDYVFVLGASDGSSVGNLTIESGKFHGATTVASVTKGKLVIEGGEFSAEPYEGAYTYLINCFDANYNNGTAIVSISGGKFYGFNPENNAAEGANTNFCAEGYTAVQDAEGYWEVVGAVAKIGNVNYLSLVEAIAAAKDGDEIEVLRNSAGAGIVINKNLTIDFGGFTYSFTEPAVGSTGTQTNGFQILKGNDVTLKNGKLNVDSEHSSKYYILVQNYADLNVVDMTLDGTNLDKWSFTDGDSYVLSNNSGEVNISGKTNIIANNDGALAYAFDACDKTSWGYELTTVTVNTTGTIDGAIEVSATLYITAANLAERSHILMQENGQLFHNGITATIKKNIEGSTTGWNTISTPVVGGSEIATTIPTADKHELYRYDETEQQWEWVTDEDNVYETLDAGRGYLYANNNDVTLTFAGQLNNDDLAYELSYTDNLKLSGFNLIGNPFTHNISSAHLTGATLAEGYYTIGADGAWLANTNGTIAPMQAILVKTDGENTNLTIKKKATETRKADNGELEISVYNNNYEDVAYVSFNEGFGLNKINHRNSDVPMIYVPVNGKDYAVAVMNKEVTEIPVSFRATTMGEYTISVKANNCNFSEMYLLDKVTGEETDLLNGEYTFIATSKDNADRFSIKFVSEETNDDSSFIYISNDEMVIDNIAGNGTLRVYDVMGRSVANYNVYESARISTSVFGNGVYLIQMSDDNGVKVQKVVID